MSIATSTVRAYAVAADGQSPAFRQASASTDVDSALERITSWIPTEVVGIYVSLVGLVVPSSDRSRWALFVLGALLVPVFVLLNGKIVNDRGAAAWSKAGTAGDPPKITGKQLLACTGLALVAFIAWSMALPSTPFLELFDNATRVGAGAVIVLALILPKVAEAFGVALPKT